MHLHDVHAGNVVGNKVVDYLPVPKKGPTGIRTDVMERGEAAQAAAQHGVPHAFTNYLKDPARPGNLMGQAFRGAKPLVQEHSPEYKMGEAAAREVWKDKIPGGLSDDKKPSDFPKGPLAKGVKVEMEHTSERPIATEIAMDHLTEDKAYYDKLEKYVEKKASLGEEAAAFSMDPSALRIQRHDAPGKGTTSPIVGMAPIQGSA
jgi:hypothetical protein